MKNLLLIEPGAKHILYPPIGLMHLAAVLRNKYNVVIKDYSGKEINKNEIKIAIEKIDPFVAGVRINIILLYFEQSEELRASSFASEFLFSYYFEGNCESIFS